MIGATSALTEIFNGTDSDWDMLQNRSDQTVQDFRRLSLEAKNELIAKFPELHEFDQGC